MTTLNVKASFHDRSLMPVLWKKVRGHWETHFTYTFRNFFHPFVGELIAKLNKESLPGMLDAAWQDSLKQDFFNSLYSPTSDNFVQVKSFPKEIDVSSHGPYANYNWELFFHIPLMIAVHLSKNQRFAEAQRWFHYIFDPTSNDQSVDPPARFWKFLAFRKPDEMKRIEDIVRLLSTPRSELSPKEQSLQDEVLNGYDAIRNKPFQPHAVARTRHLAYQYCVVMKYLDNLIAWGDHLFQQDTLESINEATQIYVLAANILGARPQRIPPHGRIQPKSFAQLKDEGLGPIGNALVDLEGQFPFNLTVPNSGMGAGGDSNPLFGIGRTLYFCVPQNDKLLGYWDTVADRLFKIRHCMNIAGVVRPLALFDPPIDPGMLVKAAAAGIDIGSVVSGLNQPIGPVRCLFLIQKALELCAEVRALGNALLAALEKGDAEHLALVRQRHEIKIAQMQQEVRFLQWKQAQEATESLLTSRKTALERLRYYQRLLDLPADPSAPDDLAINHPDYTDEKFDGLTKENFDKIYSELVGQYKQAVSTQPYPPISFPNERLFGEGRSRLLVTTNEDDEFEHLKRARDTGAVAGVANAIASLFVAVPDAKGNLHFWGLGGTVDIPAGRALQAAAKITADGFSIAAAWEREQAGLSSKTAAYERRADEWQFQYNLAAHELMQIGRQILTSLIAEHIAGHEYRTVKKQIEHAQEVDQFLHDKFTNEELYLWMQGEISRLYYEYYRFAFDTARKAERAMKQELMRPELDSQDFVKFNYWDGGRKGLLSGEALYLDVKRMEMAYHENNKRELELTKHVSLRQLDPIALLALKATGTCQVTVPEWLFDLDCPGHYLRRIKNVAVSIPSVVGPYTGVHCTLTLLRSSVRKSPSPKDGEYARQGSEDDRFMDYIGAVQSIVTSSGQNDSGLFETNLRDERFLPFEGAGAISTWKLDLPKDYRAFDYNTISDVILHIRYTARQGVDPTKVKAALDNLFQEANRAGLALLFSLKHDFPGEWHKFVTGHANFAAIIERDHFPYFTQGRKITLDAVRLVAIKEGKLQFVTPAELDLDALTTALHDTGAFQLSLAPDTSVLVRDDQALGFLLVGYHMG
jgi:hypothetical protein